MNVSQACVVKNESLIAWGAVKAFEVVPALARDVISMAPATAKQMNVAILASRQLLPSILFAAFVSTRFRPLMLLALCMVSS